MVNRGVIDLARILERATGVEPATSSLGMVNKRPTLCACIIPIACILLSSNGERTETIPIWYEAFSKAWRKVGFGIG